MKEFIILIKGKYHYYYRHYYYLFLKLIYSRLGLYMRAAYSLPSLRAIVEELVNKIILIKNINVITNTIIIIGIKFN